jgi:hypothetical protein
MSKNQTKYLFTLVGINVAKIESKYGLCSDLIVPDDQDDENTTKLSELNHEHQTPKIYPFLDGTKKLHNCHVSIIDFYSGMKTTFLRYNCYWDRHPFDTKTIGCPLLYIPNQVEKTYWSCISKDKYTIRESITRRRLALLKKINTKISATLKDCYISDGAFCSFNCCQAWIDDLKHHDPQYEFSGNLLSDIYNEMMGTKNAIITPAHHWRTLEPYGGNTTIIKFRDGFDTVSYEEHGTTVKLPKFISIGTLYEEKLNF